MNFIGIVFAVVAAVIILGLIGLALDLLFFAIELKIQRKQTEKRVKEFIKEMDYKYADVFYYGENNK